MIKKEIIDKILETIQVEEVVGDFVQLKRRGTSLIGICPFHNEKTPSFNVSATKGIFKCFGCGKGGDAITFVMEHEKYTYPEALKYLAKKYHIEVEEVENSPEYQAEVDAKESLYVINNFAAQFFQEILWNDPMGKTIGLSYFKERGFKEDIIRKFALGYSPEDWTALYDKAISAGHNAQFLLDTGLVIKNDSSKIYDRFRARAIFPIHNFTGRIIGFGGRTLKSDKNIPKYINSPESDIYHKSAVLYGLYQAKKSIRDLDNCFLVEGYADVLAVVQAGVENVVASSGTSLTIEQIKLIGRFTNNITILFDGDAAGIKASLRGLDMILEEGLNVKVVLFPDGHDPDSFIQNKGNSEFKSYIEKERKDFILFKTNILLKEAGNDPIKKAGVIRDVIESIAGIPDAIKASVFIRECSNLLKVEESILIAELNKLKLNKLKKPAYSNIQNASVEPINDIQSIENSKEKVHTDIFQEHEIIRILILYGNKFVDWNESTNSDVGSYITYNLLDITFDDPVCKEIILNYKQEIEDGKVPDMNWFIKNPNKNIAELCISLISTPYELSANWYEKHHISVSDETQNLKSTVIGAIFHLKKKKISALIIEKQNHLKTETNDDKIAQLMKEYMDLKKIENYISNFLGSVVIK